MNLIQAKILNFRLLREVTVEFGAHTAFIGGNGSGKSSVLRALERFYGSAGKLEADDHFGRDRSQPVEIELTFTELSPEAKELFETRVRNNRLTVTRVFDNGPSSGRYHGSVRSTIEFAEIRKLDSASQRNTAYRQLRQSDPKYAKLPIASSAAKADEAMTQWEAEHPDDLTLFRDDGQFFGFQNAGRGALQRFTSLVFVPAVRDAAVDAADAKASPIGRLLEILVRSAVLQRQDIAQFRDATNARYRELTSPENMPELGALAGELTADLRQLYADAVVGLSWRDAAELAVPLPAADVTLGDDGFGGPVDRQGHGLQRAFIFTLLQRSARASTRPPDSSSADDGSKPTGSPHKYQAPSLILAIEEPELYQHPTKQRHFAAVLRRLSDRSLPGAESRTQVAFASHSPMFVSVPNVSEIRFLRRVDCPGSDVKHCELRSLGLASVAEKLAAACGQPPGTFDGASLAPRLHVIGQEASEGFFAEAVVLVEGRSDKAALAAAANLLGVDFESAGIAVISAEEKGNIDRPLLIFRELGIRNCSPPRRSF